MASGAVRIGCPDTPELALPSGRMYRRPRQSLAAIDDQAMRQIVRRYGDAHTISWQHPDMVTSHAAAQLSTNDSTSLVDLDVVLAATESVLNHALHFQEVTFAHALRLTEGQVPTKRGRR